MGNLTEDRNSFFSATWMLPFFLINMLLPITASLGNFLILIALRKVTSLHPPTKLMFQCLAVSDPGVGLISQPLFCLIFMKYYFYEKITLDLHVLYIANWTTSIIFCGASILTSTALSVDRLLALFLGLRYRRVVTLCRIRAIICLFWFFAVSCVVILFCSYHLFLTTITAVIVLSLIISVVSYSKIFLRLRQHQLSVQGNAPNRQPNGGRIPLNIALYKKTVVSIALVQVALFVCYVPFIISLITIRPSDHDNSHSTTLIIVREAATTIFYLNSSLNPFLYFWRMKEVRQVVKAIIKRVFSCHS